MLGPRAHRNFATGTKEIESCGICTGVNVSVHGLQLNSEAIVAAQGELVEKVS